MIVGDWRRVVSSTESKGQLTRLFTRYLTENCHELLDDNTAVCVAGGLGELVLNVTSAYVGYVMALASTHEEADSRMGMLLQMVLVKLLCTVLTLMC